jgi:DNA polymerase-3 subunit beta
MRVTIDRDALADAVAWTTRVLPGRPALPVLAGILLDARDDSGGSLEFACFDYEVSARCDAAARIDEPGRVLVQGRLLADIARTLPAAEVSLTLESGKVLIRCGSTRFALPVMPVEDYPQLPSPPEPAGTVPGDVFATAVSQVAVAAARDETPPVLTAVKVEIDGEGVSLVATDRYRLSLREFTWRPDRPAETRSFLVRSRTLNDVARSLGPGDVTIGMTTAGGPLLGIGAGGRRTTVPTMDGDYPPVRKLFPTTSDTVAAVETAALVEGVRRVALVGDRSPVRLTFAADEVVLESGAGEDAQASDTVSAQVTGPPITIAFNAAYLLDGLGASQTPHVRLSFTEPTKPALLTGHSTPDDSDNHGFTYLLMPIRLAA